MYVVRKQDVTKVGDLGIENVCRHRSCQQDNVTKIVDRERMCTVGKAHVPILRVRPALEMMPRQVDVEAQAFCRLCMGPVLCILYWL